MDHTELVEATLKYLTAQDAPSLLALVTDDITYQLHVDEKALAFAGETRTRQAYRDVLAATFSMFAFERYDAAVRDLSEISARVYTRFIYRHRITGHRLEGSKREVFTFRGQLICRIDEYHDAVLIEAFMRLVHCTEAEEQLHGPVAAPTAAQRYRIN